MTPLQDYADSLINVESHPIYGNWSKHAIISQHPVSRQGVGPGVRAAYYAQQRARGGFGIMS
jgi:hypothetical protein